MSCVMTQFLCDIKSLFNSQIFVFHFTSATGNDSLKLVDNKKKYDTEKLIEFLRREKELGLFRRTMLERGINEVWDK
jgi:hypothetical protein